MQHDRATRTASVRYKPLKMLWKLLEASSGIEPEYADLQSAASPLRHEASRPQYVLDGNCLCNTPPNGQ